MPGAGDGGRERSHLPIAQARQNMRGKGDLHLAASLAAPRSVIVEIMPHGIRDGEPLGRCSSHAIRNRTANAKRGGFYARSGGKGAEQLDIRADDAGLGVARVNLLGQCPQMVAAIAPSVGAP